MTLKCHKPHFNVKLLSGYGVSISLKNNKICLRNGTDVLSQKSDVEEWFEPIVREMGCEEIIKH